MKIARVGILSTGEMGHRVATVLIRHGLEVVTCLAGRSARTAGLAARAGVSDVQTPEEVVALSDMVISIVVPAAAEDVARTVANAIAATKKPLLFADANAVSPMTARRIAGIVTDAGGHFVDVCIIGSAAKVGQGTILYASGTWAEEFADLNSCGLRIRILGDRPGQASAFKIVYAGLTKGVSALMAELLILAQGLGILNEIMEEYRAKFPDLVGFAESNIPGLPFRAARRSEEMEELARTIADTGLHPVMAPASGRLLASLGDLHFRSQYSDEDEKKWDLKHVIALLYGQLAGQTEGQKI